MHIDELVDREFAYAVEGDVYFRVSRFPEYGKLSGQRPDQVEEQEPNALKEDARDFALWKANKPGEDIFFSRREFPPFEPEAAAEYNHANALWLAELSRLVYRNDVEEDKPVPQPTRTSFLEKAGLNSVPFLFHRKQILRQC